MAEENEKYPKKWKISEKMENIRKNGNQIIAMTITEYLGGRRILCQHFKTLRVVKNNLQGLQIIKSDSSNPLKKMQNFI